MDLELISVTEANAIIHGRHYLGAADYPPRFCITDTKRKAIAIFSPPNAASFNILLADPLELARLWKADNAPFRTSEFIGKALRWLRKLAPECDCVFSYADPAARNSVTGKAHTGGVYRASGFTFLRTARVTDQWRTPDGTTMTAAKVYRQLKTKSRKRVLALKPDWQLIEGTPKLLFVFPIHRTLAEIRERIQAPLPADRRAAFSRAHGGFRVAVYHERFPPKTCAHCNRLFLAARSDARTCSPKCRKALSRKSAALPN